MRLHPAIATALVLVGGVLLALTSHAWLTLSAGRSAGSEVPASLLLGSLVSGILGLFLVAVGVLTSVEPRSGRGGPT